MMSDPASVLIPKEPNKASSGDLSGADGCSSGRKLSRSMREFSGAKCFASPFGYATCPLEWGSEVAV
jgi:hypothetical protein